MVFARGKNTSIYLNCSATNRKFIYTFREKLNHNLDRLSWTIERNFSFSFNLNPKFPYKTTKFMNETIVHFLIK